MGIRGKLILPPLFAFLIFMAVLHLVWAPGEYAASRKAFLDRVDVEFAAMESDLVRNILTHDTAALYASLEVFTERNRGCMSHLTLSDEEGIRIFPLFPEDDTAGTSQFIIPYEYSIEIEGELLGDLEVSLNWSDQYMATRGRIAALEGYGLGIAFVMLLFTLYWQNRLIRRPIVTLQKAMDSMAQGAMAAKRRGDGNDEIGRLAKTFYALQTEIVEQQGQLKMAHGELQEAFAEVAEKNRSLRKEVGERQKTENDLLNSQLRLQVLFDSSPAAIFIHDLKGNILDLNQTMLDLFGVTKEEGMKLSIGNDFSSADNPMEMVAVYWGGVMAGNPRNFEWISRRPHDGSTFPSQIDLRKIPYGGEEVIYATVLDISARKEMEERLAAERERLAVTLRSIGDGVITTDTNGRIVFINKAAEKLSGWRNDDAHGRNSKEVFHIINCKTGKPCVSPVTRVLTHGQAVSLDEETGLVVKHGGQVSIAHSAAPILDSKSEIIGVVIVFRDVTRERQREEELIKIKKLESVGVLAGGIAHDFNNLLSAILGNIELASSSVSGDSGAVTLLAEAQKATRRAAKLTQQLLTFSRGGDPVKEETSLVDLVRESADFVLHGSQIACEYSFPPDLWMVEADGGQVGQVIQNIVINAKHAMPDGGKIRISCHNVEEGDEDYPVASNGGSMVCIKIEDSGVGIPDEIVDKVFDPYFTTKQEGSGLGLAVCHSIVTKHDGYLRVQSKLGVGTTFFVYLLSGASVDTGVDASPEVEEKHEAKLIMVMDDQEMLRNVARAQLTRLGHEVILVEDGEQALAQYEELQDSETPVDLVIMDLTIPGGMGGQEAARKLLLKDPSVKLIVASGYSNDPVMAAYGDYGFCAAITKPFNLRELREAISAVL